MPLCLYGFVLFTEDKRNSRILPIHHFLKIIIKPAINQCKSRTCGLCLEFFIVKRLAKGNLLDSFKDKLVEKDIVLWKILDEACLDIFKKHLIVAIFLIFVRNFGYPDPK